jgi:hypothetical protein
MGIGVFVCALEKPLTLALSQRERGLTGDAVAVRRRERFLLNP